MAKKAAKQSAFHRNCVRSRVGLARFGCRPMSAVSGNPVSGRSMARKESGWDITSRFASSLLYTSYGSAATRSAFSACGRTHSKGLITAICPLFRGHPLPLFTVLLIPVPVFQAVRLTLPVLPQSHCCFPLRKVYRLHGQPLLRKLPKRSIARPRRWKTPCAAW